MKASRNFFLIFLLCIILHNPSSHICGQESSESIEFHLSGYLEELMEMSEDDETLQRVIDDLYDLLNNPLNINKAEQEDLHRLFFLNDFQIKSILSYREEYGDLLSINELLLIPGIQPQVFYRIKPFISVNELTDISYVTGTSRIIKHELITRYKKKFEIPAGFLDGTDSIRRFTGKNRYLMSRYEVSSGNRLKAGFIAEQDPGEPLFSSHNSGKPDHINGFIEFNPSSKPLKIVVGNFRAGFGQGLVSGSSFFSGMSDGIILPRTNKIARSLSASESGCMSGIALQARVRSLSVSAFFSRVQNDAVIKEKPEGNTTQIYFTSITSTGLHRSIAEIQNRNTLRETMAGTDFTYHLKNMSIGLHAKKTGFSEAMEVYSFYPGTDPPEYLTDFYNICLHYKASLPGSILFGEWATDAKGNLAILNGLTAQLHSLMSLSMVHRKYSPSYMAFYASGFGKTSRVRNEEGFYIGFTMYPLPFLTLTGYSDHYSFPWLRSNLPSPSAGSDYMINALFTSGESRISLRHKTSNRQVKTRREETGIDLNDKNILSSWRLTTRQDFNESLTLETRIDQTRNREREDNPSKGFYIGQKIILRSPYNKNMLYLSYGLFDIPDWKTRIYIYEHDLLYEFSIPVLYRKGSRFSFMLKYKFAGKSSLWIKYYLTHYNSVTERGAGADKVVSDKDSGIKVQIRILL